MEAFFGICGSVFPQYFTNAILLGVFQVNESFVVLFTRDFGINCCVSKPKILLQI
jgi:hypothetical protein